MAQLPIAAVSDVLWHGLRDALLMAWEVWWALVLGFAFSGIVQAWVPRARIESALSGSGPRPVGLATGLGNLQVRTPYFKLLNGSLWPLQSLLIRDVQMVGFYDVGVAPNDWSGLQATDVRAGYGGGLRLHCFLFEKAFLLFAFDIAQRTDKPGTTYYYFTLGQIF